MPNAQWWLEATSKVRHKTLIFGIFEESITLLVCLGTLMSFLLKNFLGFKKLLDYFASRERLVKLHWCEGKRIGEMPRVVSKNCFATLIFLFFWLSISPLSSFPFSFKRRGAGREWWISELGTFDIFYAGGGGNISSGLELVIHKLYIQNCVRIPASL